MKVYVKENTVRKGNDTVFQITVRQAGFMQYLEVTESSYVGYLYEVTVWSCPNGPGTRETKKLKRYEFSKTSEELTIYD